MLPSSVIIFSALLVACLDASVKLTPPSLDSRIVGGKSANILDHPHQASLSLNTHYCGASIINKKWLISAAHCIRFEPDAYSIFVGSNSTTSGEKYSVKKIVIHPLYNPRNLNFDISLLEIDGEIKFNDFVRPIELATKEPPVDLLVNVTGWGRLAEGGISPENLQVVSVPIVNRTLCQRAYEGQSEVTLYMICAGYNVGGKDSCQGDSGGPLSANGTLYGIVSWGFGCARPSYPGVYANVASITTWAKVITKI